MLYTSILLGFNVPVHISARKSVRACDMNTNFDNNFIFLDRAIVL